jgi:hypothetical protein
MKMIHLVSFTLLLLPTAHAETPYERELQQLIDQRDKALAPVLARFNAAAEQLMKRAAQGGDLETAEKIKAEMAQAAVPGSAKSARELQTQLAGSTWKAGPSATLRPGLAGTLNFTEKTVEPGGYSYVTDAHNKVTLTFKGGDTQVMQLSPDGKQLKVMFGKSTFTYDRVAN